MIKNSQFEVLLSAFILIAISAPLSARNVSVTVQAAKITEIAIQEKRLPVETILMFGRDAVPPGGEPLRTVEVTAKTWMTTKDVGVRLTDAEACERAAVEAVGKLSGKADSGPNIAIGRIVSQWQEGVEFSNPAQIECRAGSNSVGVGLRATVFRVQ